MLIASAVFQPAPAGGQTRYEKTTVAYRAVGEHEVLVDVPYEQSQMMAAQLRHHRVPFTLKTIENGEHGLGGGDPQQIEDAYQFLREFIVEHLTAE